MNEERNHTPKGLTMTQVRAMFWENHPEADRQKIRDHSGKGRMYKADTRMMFVDFVDSLHRDGQISDITARNITL